MVNNAPKSRIQEHNPFHYLRPVPPKAFLGRGALLEEMAWDITLDSGDSHACIGGRRFGKSSLLIALHHYLCKPEAQKGDHFVLPILIDFKEHSFSSEAAFFATVLQEVTHRVDTGARSFVRDPSPVKVSLDQNWLDKLLTDNPPGLSLSQFKEAWGYILNELCPAEGPTRLVLLLDEVDDSLRYPWHQDLFGQLRSLVYIGGLADSVRLVLAGSRRFLDEVSDRGSPLWNILKLHYLTTFDRSATYQLMERASNLSEEAQQEIWLQSGGHPFLAQYLLHHLWKMGIAQADVAMVGKVVNQFLHEEQNHLNGWARALGTAGLRVYSHLVNEPGWLDELDLIGKTSNLNIPVKRVLVDLLYHGFIIHDGDWTRYRRTGNLLREWYLQEGEQIIKTMPAEMKGKTPLEQLADNIRQDLALRKDYEDTLRLSSDPREKARCQREIERLKQSLAAQQREYKELSGEEAPADWG